MAFWAYHRKFHLVLLLVLLSFLLFSFLIFVLMFGFRWGMLKNAYLGLVYLLFLVLWFARGMMSTRALSPWFHYISLIFEWLVHFVFFSALLYVYLKAILSFVLGNASRNEYFEYKWSIVFVVSNLLLLALLVIILLFIFKWAIFFFKYRSIDCGYLNIALYFNKPYYAG